jgi:hypothetical protein
MPQQARALNDDVRISSLKTDAAALHDYVMLPMQISIAKNILASWLAAARYFQHRQASAARGRKLWGCLWQRC